MRYVIICWLVVFGLLFLLTGESKAAQKWFEHRGIALEAEYRVVLTDKDCPDGAAQGMIAYREWNHELAGQDRVVYGCWHFVANKVYILWKNTGKISAIPKELFTYKEID